MSEIFVQISSGQKRMFLRKSSSWQNIQVVTDSSSDSPLLRPSGSGRPRTVYLERVSDIHASQQTFDGQKMLPQDINLERNGSGLSRATSLGEGLHRWQCNMTLSHISRWHVTKLCHISRWHVTARHVTSSLVTLWRWQCHRLAGCEDAPDGELPTAEQHSFLHSKCKW